MMFTIWERYFFKEILKTLFLFLLCFYGLYALIDYANHGRSFQQSKGFAHLIAFCIYYGCEFVFRSEVLVPFAILISTIKTLCKLNNNNELVAMLACGIKYSRLLRPFLLLGLFFTLLMYLNIQFVLPVAAKEQQLYEDAHSRRKDQKSAKIAVESLSLEDKSTLLYQRYERSEEQFFDVYWVISIDEVYKIKYLYPFADPPIGYYVDYFQRNDHNELTLKDSYFIRRFPDLKLHTKSFKEALIIPENLSYTQLWGILPAEGVNSEKEARVLSTFHRKLALPWLCLLAVIAPAPFCLRFSRQFPTFAVYAGSLFGLIAVYIILDAVHVLGRRQLVDPLYALWTPLVLFFLIFGWRYVRLK